MPPIKDMILGFLPTALRPPAQSGEVTGKYYKRSGACNQCGKCCTNIYLVHERETIKTTEEFERLQKFEAEYRGFVPIDSDEHGMRFQCKHLRDDKTCEIYDERPSFCRKYPSEYGVLLGAELATGCGYKFDVLKPFDQVLADQVLAEETTHENTVNSKSGKERDRAYSTT